MPCLLAESEWAARFIDSSVLEKDPGPSITVQGRLHRLNSILSSLWSQQPHCNLIVFCAASKKLPCVFFTPALLLTPSNVLVVLPLSGSTRQEGHRPMLFAVLTMSLGTTWCWHVQACSLLSQLMIWRSLHCMSWLSTAQETHRNLTTSKGGIVCTQYSGTLLFPSGDICLDACYDCRNIFSGLWKQTASSESSCVYFFSDMYWFSFLLQCLMGNEGVSQSPYCTATAVLLFGASGTGVCLAAAARTQHRGFS